MEGKNYEDIDERTFKFAVRVVKMTMKLPSNPPSWVIGKQVIRSSTSINSNIVHAKVGVSRKDFTHYYRVALKEAEETKRWLEMIIAVELMPAQRMGLLIQENQEIIKILVTIIKNTIKKEN
ncbi:MAG: four helix bundle protein [Patescibacteria group bacterium]|jgi:four helix bundle protein